MCGVLNGAQIAELGEQINAQYICECMIFLHQQRMQYACIPSFKMRAEKVHYAAALKIKIKMNDALAITTTFKCIPAPDGD